MTYMHIVPPLALFLAKQPLVEKFDLSSLETLVTAAAPLGGHVQSEVEQRLNCNFVQGNTGFNLSQQSICSPLYTGAS